MCLLRLLVEWPALMRSEVSLSRTFESGTSD